MCFVLIKFFVLLYVKILIVKIILLCVHMKQLSVTTILCMHRCMDLDGDGYLSMYELEYFYDEQLQRMSAIGIECLPFEDCLCQV